MFADANSSELIAMVTACAITSGLVAQIILQIMARIEAAKVAQQAKEDAAKAAKQAKEDAEKAQLAAKQAAVETKQVKAALVEATAATADKLAGLAEVANATHTLVNSNFGVLLKANEEQAHRIAELTPDDPAAAVAAALASKHYREHQAKQAVVDQEKKK